MAAALLVLLAIPGAGWVCAAAGPNAGDAPSAQPPAPPSLLVVTFDTTRADALGCYGRTPSPTPHLDALAATGVRFRRAISPVPLTLPSHATLWTGLSPRRHGVHDNAPDRLAEGPATLAELLAADGYDTGAVVSAAVLDRSSGILRGFRLIDDQVRQGPRRWFDWKERGASQTTAAAEKMLAELRPPFLLWVHFYDPHLPYVPPEPYAKRFAGEPYLGELAFADAELGRLLTLVRKRAPRLWVLAAGDHGESLGEHGEKDHGVLIYQATERVPLILSGPGLPRGRVVGETVGLVDLLPTVLGLTGLPAPKELGGRDLAPTWDKGREARPEPHASYEIESFHGERAYGWQPLEGLVRGGLKLILGVRPELYDLDQDPSELHDIAAAKPGLAAALRRDLEERGGGRSGSAAGGTREEAASEEDAERMATLRSLGYAGGAAASPAARRPDPRRAITWLADLDRARALIRRQGTSPAAANEAVTLLTALLGRNPANQPARLSLGSAYLAAGKPEQAVRVFRDAVERREDDYLTHYNLALGLEALSPQTPSLLAQAEASYRRALELFPRYVDAYTDLAELLLRQGKTEAALRTTGEAASHGAVDPQLLSLRGELLAATGQAAQADDAFAQALLLDPRFPSALEGRGKLAYSRGDYRAAATFYSQALAAEPQARRARTLGSILLLGLNDPAGAREAFRKALELEPRGPDADRVREMLRDLETTSPPSGD